jgi:diaminopimelate decarboxylase
VSPEPFQRRDHVLRADGVPLTDIAERFGTPTYVYCGDAIAARYGAFDAAFARHPHRICYAVKANANLAVLGLLARLGAGFDIVSGGELERVLRAGGKPEQIVFAGVGKSRAEIDRALAVGIGCFNVESAAELGRIEHAARAAGRPAPISIRVNPDVDAVTHPYISTGLKENKFGVAMAPAFGLYRQAAASPWLDVHGIDCHIGSQLTRIEPFVDALRRVLDLVDRLGEEGIHLAHIDVGGGLGVRYRDEAPPETARYAEALLGELQGRPQTLLLEPGRWLVAEAGVLLTRVEYLKENEGRHFAIIDAAMNDLMRPALYQAWHDIVPVTDQPGAAEQVVDVVGPVCESSDVLGRERPLAVREGDLLAILDAGAYGFGMASNYNSRNRPAEVLVRQGEARLVRRRETIEDQLALESVDGL